MLRRFLPPLAAALAAASFLPGARAQDNLLDIGVRATVVDRPFGNPDPQAGPAQGKVYGIVAVQEVKGEGRLVRPVDEGMIMGLLTRELNAHGFRLYSAAEPPEILLMVHYGRGYLANPYQISGGRTEAPSTATSATMPGGGGTGGPTIAITGVPTQLFKELTPGYQAKLQKAKYEKLYIRVTAWSYAKDAKGHHQQLWNTTLVADDPEHRDLNAIAEKMLAAGAPYFGRQIAEEELDVYQPLPEGHVKVGTPEVVEPKK